MRRRISEQNQFKPMVQADQNDIRGSSFSIATTALAMGLVSQPTSQAGSRVGSPLGSPVSSTPGTPDSDRSSIDERYRTSTFKSQLTVESRNPWTVWTDTEVPSKIVIQGWSRSFERSMDSWSNLFIR